MMLHKGTSWTCLHQPSKKTDKRTNVEVMCDVITTNLGSSDQVFRSYISNWVAAGEIHSPIVCIKRGRCVALFRQSATNTPLHFPPLHDTSKACGGVVNNCGADLSHNSWRARWKSVWDDRSRLWKSQCEEYDQASGLELVRGNVPIFNTHITLDSMPLPFDRLLLRVYQVFVLHDYVPNTIAEKHKHNALAEITLAEKYGFGRRPYFLH